MNAYFDLSITGSSKLKILNEMPLSNIYSLGYGP
jgi:hypothetical protein